MKFLIYLYTILFTKRYDEYPTYEQSKTSKEDTGAKDIDVSGDRYAEIIDDFPTYTRDK